MLVSQSAKMIILRGPERIMRKSGQYLCGLRTHIGMVMLFSVLACPPAFAQIKGKNSLPRECQPVLRTYPIARVSAAQAEYGLEEVFKQRSITVSQNARQNSVVVWATDSEHAQIEHYLMQQQVLGSRLPSQATSDNLITLMQRRRARNANANASAPLRFADLQAGDTGRNVPAYWQNQNVPQQNQVRQVAGQVAGTMQAPQSQGLPPVAGNILTKQIRLQRTSARDFEAKIVNAIQSRSVPVSRSTSGNQTVYMVPLPNNQRLEMAVDPQTNIVTIAGPADRIDTFAQIVSLVDNETPQNGVMGVVPVTRGNEQSFRTFAGMLNQPAGQFAGTQNQNPSRTPSQGSDLRFVPPSNVVNGDMPQQPLPPDASALVGPVEVEILEGGMIIIRARTAGDLALVRDLVNYIEVTSREYEPTVLVVPMIHGDCVRVSAVALQLYNEWYVDRSGRISVTPLVRPNSILLIGYPGGLQLIQDLIAKLDSPVDAAAQIEVFPLRHASSDAVTTTLTSIYNARLTNATQGQQATGQLQTGTGLASPVTVTNDQRNNSVIVQAAPRDLYEIAALILKMDKADSEAVMLVKAFPLRFSSASSLQTILTQALAGQALTGALGGLGGTSQQSTPQLTSLSFAVIDANRGEHVINAGIFAGVQVVAEPSSNQLIVKAPTKCMQVIEAVIQSLDCPPQAVAQLKIFTIINGDASTLVTMLNNIFQTTGTGAGGGAAGQTGPSYQYDGVNENSSLIPVRFTAETRTNSIVAVGSANVLAMVDALLLTLDEEEMHNRRMMVYRLLNTPAQTIATTLSTFLQNERQLRQQSNVLIGETDIFTNDVIITAEIETNSLLVSTTPNRFEQLRKMIQVLDEAPAMVQIKVVIAEVDISNTNELGFELGLQDSVLFDRSILNSNDLTTVTKVTNTPGVGSVQEQVIVSESRTPGFNFNNTTQGLGNNKASNSGSVGTQGISNFALGRQNSELGYGGLVVSASSESVSILVRALEESKRLTVLNNPTLYAGHNQTSRLSVGQSVPTITSADIDINGRQMNQVSDREVGILLEVTPRIALDDSVTMQISAQKSSMDSESSGTPIFVQDGVTIRSARTNSASISTTIRTQSGEVAVLGGLNSQEDNMVHRAVPVVSKIPLLGQLFQYNYKYCTRKELIFVFTPQVYRTTEEAYAVNQLAMARMHWCVQNVANMLDTTSVKTRTSDFTTSETRIERGQVITIDHNDILSDDAIIMDSSQQDNLLPLPGKVPVPRMTQ